MDQGQVCGKVGFAFGEPEDSEWQSDWGVQYAVK